MSRPSHLCVGLLLLAACAKASREGEDARDSESQLGLHAVELRAASMVHRKAEPALGDADDCEERITTMADCEMGRRDCPTRCGKLQSESLGSHDAYKQAARDHYIDTWKVQYMKGIHDKYKNDVQLPARHAHFLDEYAKMATEATHLAGLDYSIDETIKSASNALDKSDKVAEKTKQYEDDLRKLKKGSQTFGKVIAKYHHKIHDGLKDKMDGTQLDVLDQDLGSYYHSSAASSRANPLGLDANPLGMELPPSPRV